MELKRIAARFLDNLPKGIEFASIRIHQDDSQYLKIRRDNLESPKLSSSLGYMVTVIENGAFGYGASPDVSAKGIAGAISKARELAQACRGKYVFDFSSYPKTHPRGEFYSPVTIPWESTPLSSKIDLLKTLSSNLKIHSSIVDWETYLWRDKSTRLYVTNGGGEVFQIADRIMPAISVTAANESEAETRTWQGLASVQQKGLEYLTEIDFWGRGTTVAEEAIALLQAPVTPNGRRDLILGPDQMILQIHESIGHPLELDRILGDERNYAGTSFVSLDMIGNYQYGSPLLNITFDPTMPYQAASSTFDDDGTPTSKEYIIKDGILKRPLGGTISQLRAGEIPGVACSRADSWRRPPIDRMANLNLEAGTTSLSDMIAKVEKGILMKTNRSWSIDDSRRKFQFGCEWGQLIENGELKHLVKKPSYRGISSDFWRNLGAVGDQSTFQVMGTPYCGKGEPNQGIFVGHASPACLFHDIEVFGG